MLTDVCLIKLAINERNITNTISRNRYQQIVSSYSSPIPLCSFWRVHKLRVIKVKTAGTDILTANKQCPLVRIEGSPSARTARNELRQLTKRLSCPVLRNNSHIRLLVAWPYCHTAPIFFRCSSTRLASKATSSVSCGNGEA